MNGTQPWDQNAGDEGAGAVSGNDNARETGARTYPASRETGQETDQRAAENAPPRDGQGLSEPEDGTVDHGDGMNPPGVQHDIIKETGAGPAIARHSKDAKH